MAAPLPIPSDHWRSRWLVLPRWGALHRVASIEWEDPPDMIGGQGETVCGRKGRLFMPGIFSRMSLKRCPRCCRMLGLPQGNGAPFNVLGGAAKEA